MFKKMFRREYLVTVFLTGNNTFPSGKHYMSILLRKITKINNNRIVGRDMNDKYYEFKCPDTFYYEIKRRS